MDINLLKFGYWDTGPPVAGPYLYKYAKNPNKILVNCKSQDPSNLMMQKFVLELFDRKFNFPNP